MPCADDNEAAFTVPDDQHPVTDWAGIHPYKPKRVYSPQHPDALKKLVRVVLDAEAAPGKLKAVGSNYSLSRAQVTDDFLVETHGLNRELSLPHHSHPRSGMEGFLPTGPGWPSPEYAAKWLDTILVKGVAFDAENGGHLIHVEGGATIKQLLGDLTWLNLALPTMGAGGGQTLAGALSTGTHGSDVGLPPLVDFVRAVHIVGPGGRQWWITPAKAIVGGPGLAGLPGWCPDTYVVRDDDWFRAALLTVGRFGVVHSMVLEVGDQYGLIETTNKSPGSTDGAEVHHWKDVRKELLASIDGDYFSGGVFDRAHDGEKLRFYSVLIDLAEGKRCWVTRRWKTRWEQEHGFESSAQMDCFLCSSTAGLVGIVAASTALFASLEAEAAVVPVMGVVWAAALTALNGELVAMAASSKNIGDFLAQVFAKLGSITPDLYGYAAPEVRAIIRSLGHVLLGGAQIDERVSSSNRILDSHDYNLDGCSSGNSSEFFFDARTRGYIDFVDAVLAKAAGDDDVVPGYIALRFVQKSKALLAMERFDLTVAVEVAEPRSLTEDLYPGFKAKLQALALQHQAVPHWGQEHSLTAERTQEIYGEDLETWRWAVAELEAGGHPTGDSPQTFSSAFTVSRGLEPAQTIDGIAAIHHYRAQRSGGVLASVVDLLMNV